ncbi:MAG: DegT/DnrJ/EryC1/StrS family aminotransferase [Candidatus Methanoperedens sp.]
MKIPILRIPFTDEEISSAQNSIGEVLKSGQLAMGKYVAEFERKFAEFVGTKYAIGVNSGTSALEICLRAMDVRNSSVIVPTNTFMATATSVIHAGGKVIFSDVLKKDLCMDPENLKEKIQKNTKAVILVHIGGIISSELKAIQEICEDHKLALIEDAAHAHGSTIDGKKAGALGIAGAFSFYPTKVMTCGEGGMITTDNEDIYKSALMLRDHGKPDHRFNKHTEFGYNWRLSEIHAIIGLEQMNKIDWILSERRRVARIYDETLRDVEGIELIKMPINIESSYYKYIVYLKEELNKDHVKDKMNSEYEVELTGEVYADPCHSQPVFKKYPEMMLNEESDKFPGAEYVCNRHICLPLYPGLTEEEISYVVESLKSVVASD